MSNNDKENFEKYYTPATAFNAEGARVGVVTCKICGASIFLDEREEVNPLQIHIDWHWTRHEC